MKAQSFRFGLMIALKGAYCFWLCSVWLGNREEIEETPYQKPQAKTLSGLGGR